MHKLLALGALAALLVGSAPALAEDWVVAKLRGTVQMLADGNWVDLQRGDTVPDARTVRTLGDGHADLQRGAEIVTLGADTQIQIHDRTDVRFTTVTQDFGSVEVEAQVENVQHFEVDTSYLAAVVKGTHFTVTADNNGASVSVARGMVAVESKLTQHTTTVTVGQTASVAPQFDMRLSGVGILPPIYDAKGLEVQPAAPPDSPLAALPPANAGTAPDAPATGAPGVTPSGDDLPPQPAQTVALRGSIDIAGLSTIVGPKATAPKEEPLNLVTVLIGGLIGAAVGAVALLLRRAVS